MLCNSLYASQYGFMLYHKVRCVEQGLSKLTCTHRLREFLEKELPLVGVCRGCFAANLINIAPRTDVYGPLVLLGRLRKLS